MQLKLSELKLGETGRVNSIEGSISFRKRIIELGFVPGVSVKSIRKAPLEDPAAYLVRGTHISLRDQEAEKILLHPEHSGTIKDSSRSSASVDSYDDANPMQAAANGEIRVALVGNPNSGKTSIFNAASRSKEKTANYSGVTVTLKEARVFYKNYKIKFIDLPGTYSLNSESPDEAFVPEYLFTERPDVILNVIDSTRLERNLYLTTQLIDLGLPIIVALNMFDELRVNKKNNFERMGKMLGSPFVPTIARKGIGVPELLDRIIRISEGSEPDIRKVRITLSRDIEGIITVLEEKISESRKNGSIGFDTRFDRFVALSLLEGTHNNSPFFDLMRTNLQLIEDAANARGRIDSLYSGSISDTIASDRYGFIEGALKENNILTGSKRDNFSHKVDNILTHKFLGLPIFFGIIFLMFFLTFSLGNYPVGWLENLFNLAAQIISGLMPDVLFRDLLTLGIIPGVGAVAVFLPNILLLFLFISILEDTGYMARTAFIVDRIMHKAGLHGKSFIPLLIGFGCNVPAIMATRTIEDRRNRLLTMMITPFMSCSARLPVYILFISAYFASHRSLVLFLLYLTGIIMAWLSAVLFRKVFFKEATAPFVMELPPYRIPTGKAIFRHMWFKTWYFIKKMGGIILLASVLIWALGYFPTDRYTTGMKDHVQKELTVAESLDKTIENSYIARIGKFIHPVFVPLGFDWKMSVSILAGLPAKEIVVSTLGVLDQDLSRMEKPMLGSLSFMLFILLYFPCIGTLTIMRKESGSIRWPLLTMAYTTIVAWLVSFIVFQGGLLIS